MGCDVKYLELRPEHSDFGEKMIMEPFTSHLRIPWLRR